MSPSIHPLLSFIAALFSAALILPSESFAEGERRWEGSVILTRDVDRNSSSSYRRWLREQRKLERKLEREQTREARREARTRYSRGNDYYPSYSSRKNPVVSTDEYLEEGYAPDGTYHGEEVIEDRHQSYYSPGRQQAITPPQTTQDTWTYGDGTVKNREKTTWIGSDGRYHSTTINRTTQTDDEGNSHTQSHVDLKRQAASPPSQGATSTPKAGLMKPSIPVPKAPGTNATSVSSQVSPQASSPSTGSSSSSKREPTPKPTQAEPETPSVPPAVSQ